MKTLSSSPLAASCCYNICLLVDSGVIRSAQRPTLLSLDKSEQESWRRELMCIYIYARTCAPTKREERGGKRDRSSGALQLLCIDVPVSRVSHVKIYLLPPSTRTHPPPFLYPLPSSPLFNLVAVCHCHHCYPFIRLLPTCTSVVEEAWRAWRKDKAYTYFFTYLRRCLKSGKSRREETNSLLEEDMEDFRG